MVTGNVWCLVPLLLAAACGPAMAEERGPSCQEQLLVKTTHDQWIMQKRAEVEDQLALVSAQAQVLERKVQLLTKENADLRAKFAPLDKPKE